MASSRVGREHQHAAALAPRRAAIGGQAVDDRQGECGGLAGAGLGDAEQVAAGEHDRDGLGLDGRRRLVAFVLQRLEDRRGEAEIGKDSSIACSFLWPRTVGCADRVSVRRRDGAASCLGDTPRVLGCRMEFSGRSTGGRSGPTGPDTFVLHAAGAPQIAHRAVAACLMLRRTSQTLSMHSFDCVEKSIEQRR